MTICAIKVCRNYSGRLKATKKVSYHRIPTDPILRTRWIEIIRKSRGEDVWQPVKTTVICSEHFRAKDLYYVDNQQRRRLKKEAIPRKALFLSSIETDDDESDGLLEEKEKISDCVTNVVDNPVTAIFLTSLETDDDESDGLLEEKEKKSDCVTNVVDHPDPKSSGSNEHVSFGSMETSDSMTSSNIKVKESGSASSCLPGQATGSQIGNEQTKESESEDFSDLDSVYDSPKKSKMRRDLQRRIRLQKKHTLKIQSLNRQNIRLKKKNASLRRIIGILKKERQRYRPRNT